MREKFQRKQTVNDFKSDCNTKGYNLYNNTGTFISPIFTFSLAGNTIVYTPIRGKRREKYSNKIIYEGGKCQIWPEKKHFCVHIFFHRQSLSHLSTGKVRIQTVRNGIQKG